MRVSLVRVSASFFFTSWTWFRLFLHCFRLLLARFRLQAGFLNMFVIFGLLLSCTANLHGFALWRECYLTLCTHGFIYYWLHGSWLQSSIFLQFSVFPALLNLCCKSRANSSQLRFRFWQFLAGCPSVGRRVLTRTSCLACFQVEFA